MTGKRSVFHENLKNKGFSLIEIIIAVAIMTLLISPILVNLSQSLKISADAKERQYAVDDATKIVEFFRKSEIQDLPKGGSGISIAENDDGTQKIVYHDLKPGQAETEDHKLMLSCDLCEDDGSVIRTVNYNATDYYLSYARLGKKRNWYYRTVVMDDLDNRILASNNGETSKYEVQYNISEDSVPEGFVRRNDGSCVKFDNTDSSGNVSDPAAVRHVTSVICSNRANDEAYQDPNDVNLGNVQDLDSSKVAIIEGYETSLDQQFESDMLSKMMERLSYCKGLKPTEPNYISDENYERITRQLESYFNSVRDNHTDLTRLIKISSYALKDSSGNPIQKKDASGKKLTNSKGDPVYTYHVSCDVYYKAKFTWLGQNFGANDSDNDLFRYNIFSQDFETDRAPDVYLYYEPFITDSTKDRVWYAYNDYIVTYGDEVTSGENGSNIYLLKSDNSWQSTVTTGPARTSDVFYTYSGSTYIPVKIYLNRDVDQGKESTENCMKVYTNFNIRYGTNTIDNDIDHDIVVNHWNSSTSQFFTTLASESGTNASPDLYIGSDPLKGQHERLAYDEDCIQPMQNFESTSARLYSITVNLTRVSKMNSSNTAFDSLEDTVISFTGAKGAD